MLCAWGASAVVPASCPGSPCGGLTASPRGADKAGSVPPCHRSAAPRRPTLKDSNPNTADPPALATNYSDEGGGGPGGRGWVEYLLDKTNRNDKQD